jgi:hypothetical protein
MGVDVHNSSRSDQDGTGCESRRYNALKDKAAGAPSISSMKRLNLNYKHDFEPFYG